MQVAELEELLEKKEKLVAMMAPSFTIVYEYPQIIGKLKRLGFVTVVEVSAGAKKTNEALIAAIKKNPQARFITSPCPSFVRFVRKKYPHLEKYLALAVDSPMIATTKLVKQKWPGYRPVFVGPCNVKKLEASEDHPELNILVLTYKEMDEVFNYFKIQDKKTDNSYSFDLTGSETRLYPISGGLTQSSKVREILSEDEIQVVSGWQNCIEAVEKFETNTNTRLLDILFCEGGCINGPGIISNLSLEERRKKITDYWENCPLVW